MEEDRNATEPRFVIEPQEAAAMAAAAGVSSVVELLPTLVPSAKRLARTPISKYNVGAVGLGASGRIYLGVNLEFPGIPLHHSVHAEQFLVASAAASGETAIRCIAVSSVPCGHCRQFLQEIRGASEIQILVVQQSESAFRPLSDLLPNPFGPPDLLQDHVPLLLEPHHNRLGPTAAAAAPWTPVDDSLRAAAEAAARTAHAPYSGCPSGFALADAGGAVYAGSYAESAAYNPSLGPVQAALVAYVAAGGGADWGIVAAALVEGEEATLSQEATARVLLAAVAPGAHLRVYRFRSIA